MKEYSRQPVHVDPPTPALSIKPTGRSDIENNAEGKNSFITFHIVLGYLRKFQLKRDYINNI